MADSIKIGNLDISAFKVGSDDCKVYLGNTLLYPQSQPQTLQWVTFNNGDTIPSDLDIYGISGTAQNLLSTFGCDIDANICFNIAPRNKIEYSIFDSNGFVCAGNNPGTTEIVNIIFSDYGCVDYLNKSGTISGTLQLYIYA